MPTPEQTTHEWRRCSAAVAALLALSLCACTRPLSSFVIPPPSGDSDSHAEVPTAPQMKLMVEGEWRAVRTGCERAGSLPTNLRDAEAWLLPLGRPALTNAAATAAAVDLQVCDAQWLRLPELGPGKVPVPSEEAVSSLKLDRHTTVLYLPLYSVFHDTGSDTWRLEVVVEDLPSKHMVRRWRVAAVQRFGGPFG